MRKLILISGSILLVACAKNPASVKPASIPMAAYASMNCATLQAERTSVYETQTQQYKEQTKAATTDAMSVVLIGLPVSSVTGGNVEGDLSVTKGKIIAIEAAQKSNGCEAP